MTIATTMSIIRIIYWFLLHDRIGPVVINMSRAITDIFTIAMTYAFVLVGFSTGKCWELLVVDQSSGSTYLLEADRATGSTFP